MTTFPVSYLAFDPGDRWVGVAIARAATTHTIVSTALFDRNTSAFGAIRGLLSRRHVLGLTEQLVLVAEDFRIRPMAFNAFSGGNTLRFLGALAYEAEHIGVPLALVSTTADGTKMPLTNKLAAWKIDWPRPASWSHGLSAWAALQRALVRDAPDVLLTWRDAIPASQTTIGKSSFTELLFNSGAAHVAPLQRWSHRT